MQAFTENLKPTTALVPDAEVYRNFSPLLAPKESVTFPDWRLRFFLKSLIEARLRSQTPLRSLLNIRFTRKHFEGA